jgi:hypothetical protein
VVADWSPTRRSGAAAVQEVEGDSDGVVEQYKTLLREVDIPEYKALAAKEVRCGARCICTPFPIPVV